jgi:DNA-binding LytR/AlgR family response regulator
MSGKKILVIEDDYFVLTNIETLLLEENYSVYAASNGKLGIEKAKEIIPDLILCDISMPEADGYEVIKTLSRSKKTRSIPFIFLTAKVERSDLRLGMELGADDYLFKPFTINELLNSVKVRLHKRDELIADIIKDKSDTGKGKRKRKYDMDEKILVSVNDKQMFVGVNDIMYITSIDHYTSLKMSNGKSVLMRHTIQNWEDSLPENSFLRIHRGTMVNINYIEKMEKYHTGHKAVYMKDSHKPFVVSKSYYSKIRGMVK